MGCRGARWLRLSDPNRRIGYLIVADMANYPGASARRAKTQMLNLRRLGANRPVRAPNNP